jgi:hypothetical protein
MFPSTADVDHFSSVALGWPFLNMPTHSYTLCCCRTLSPYYAESFENLCITYAFIPQKSNYCMLLFFGACGKSSSHVDGTTVKDN